MITYISYWYIYRYLDIYIYTHIIIYMHVQFDIWRFINTRQHTVLVAPSTSDLFPPGEPWLRSCVLASCAHSSMRLWLLRCRDSWEFVLGSQFLVDNYYKKNRGKATSNNKTCSRVKQKQCVVFNILETCCSYFGRIFFLKTIGWFQGPRAQKPGPRCFRFWHFRIHPITEPTSSSFKLSDGVVYHVAESTWNFCPRKVLGMTWSVFF